MGHGRTLSTSIFFSIFSKFSTGNVVTLFSRHTHPHPQRTSFEAKNKFLNSPESINKQNLAYIIALLGLLSVSKS